MASKYLSSPTILEVTAAEVGLIIRDLAPDNDAGGIDYHTFLEVLHAARKGHVHPGSARETVAKGPPYIQKICVKWIGWFLDMTHIFLI